MKFFRYNEPLITYTSALIICEIILILVFVFTQTYTNLWFCLGLFIICALIYLIFRQVIFSRVEIDNFYIKIFYKNKTIQTMNWNDVVKVERTLDNISQNFTL